MLRARLRSSALACLTLTVVACSDDGVTGAGGGDSTASTTVTSTSSTTGATTTSSSTTGAGGAATGTGGAATGTGGATTGGGGGGGAPTASACFAGDYVNNPTNGPDYDMLSPIIGTHCLGTNQQDITGVERVVFLGDSVTVGTPPNLSSDYYRNKLAGSLASKFGLTAPSILWKTVNVLNGVTNVKDSGDFSSCSKWGARTDDFLMGGDQFAGCFPADSFDKKTLVIMTMGGNDISALTQDAINGADMATLWTETQAFVADMRAAIEWLKTPGRFPNGVYVIFGNIYEFTDGTGNTQSCDVSSLAGFSDPVPAPAQLAEMVVWAEEQYMSIAVDNGVDMVFSLEEFCGHGFERDNPAAPCYRGPGQAAYFDLTCIHPNPTGHQHLADMFMAVVNE